MYSTRKLISRNLDKQTIVHKLILRATRRWNKCTQWKPKIPEIFYLVTCFPPLRLDFNPNLTIDLATNLMKLQLSQQNSTLYCLLSSNWLILIEKLYKRMGDGTNKFEMSINVWINWLEIDMSVDGSVELPQFRGTSSQLFLRTRHHPNSTLNK